MQNNYQWENQTAVYPPPVYPAPPAPTPQQQERRSLRKASNGLGFFMLTYFLIMTFLAQIISELLKGFNVTDRFVTALELFIYVASPLIAAFFYRVISRRRLSDNFPKSHVPLKKLIPLMLLGMAAAMIANQLAAIFDNNLSLFGLENQLSQEISSQSWTQMLESFLLTAIIPAFAEELAFRGIFMGVLRKYGDAFAIISSALVFGAMHCNTTQFVFATALGLIFGYIDCKANSIVPSVIVHFLNNFYAVLRETFENTVNDDTLSILFGVVIIALFCLLGILSYLYLAKADKDFFRMSNDDENLFREKTCLTLKQKLTAFFTTPGVIICLALFLSETILNLIPSEVFEQITGAIRFG